jgi:cell division protein FtsI (penicillin-binding protein 3)
MSSQRVAAREPVSTPFEWRGTMRSRVVVCAAVFAFWTVGIEARLLYLQVVTHADLTARAKRQQIRTVTPAAKRGEILDRNGRVFAYSVNAETIAADPSQVEDPAQAARELCQALGDCNGAKLEELTSQLSRKTRFVYVERKASVDAARRVNALKLPGIVIYPESRRYYPKRELAAHVLGYVGLDNEGLAGVESAFESRVRGRDGRLILEIDSRRAARAAREERPATAGDSLELTVDQYLQHIAERELKIGVDEHNAAGGTAIIMDPHSGEILALANYPTYNPNSYNDANDTARKNRAIQDIYEPGSTFKLVTASAAIEEGVLQTTDLIDCSPGYITFSGRKPIRDVHPYGVLSFEDVIVKSSNVGAIKAGLRIGPERLGRYINRFGFGQTLAPDFRGESAGIVWDSSKLDTSSLASVSMGYQISVTPLQMASAVSSVANGGTLYEPHLLRAFIRNGRRDPVAPKALRRTITPQTATTLTGIMEAVVERGTAKAAQIEGYTVAGKTGTAAKIVNGRYSDYDYNTSFVGFVPSRKPVMTIIVVIDSPHGKVTAYGGTVAAPIFQRIAEASLRHLGVGPTINAPPPIMVTRNGIDLDGPQPRPAGVSDPERIISFARTGLMPDLRGLSARAAVKSLTTVGLTVKLSGDGFVVDQFPEAGATLVPGDVAKLKLARRMPDPAAGGPQQ